MPSKKSSSKKSFRSRSFPIFRSTRTEVIRTLQNTLTSFRSVVDNLAVIGDELSRAISSLSGTPERDDVASSREPSPAPLDQQPPVAGPSGQQAQDAPNPDATLASSETQAEPSGLLNPEPILMPPPPRGLIRENASDNYGGLNQELRRQDNVRITTRPRARGRAQNNTRVRPSTTTRQRGGRSTSASAPGPSRKLQINSRVILNLGVGRNNNNNNNNDDDNNDTNLDSTAPVAGPSSNVGRLSTPQGLDPVQPPPIGSPHPSDDNSRVPVSIVGTQALTLATVPSHTQTPLSGYRGRLEVDEEEVDQLLKSEDSESEAGGLALVIPALPVTTTDADQSSGSQSPRGAKRTRETDDEPANGETSESSTESTPSKRRRLELIAPNATPATSAEPVSPGTSVPVPLPLPAPAPAPAPRVSNVHLLLNPEDTPVSVTPRLGTPATTPPRPDPLPLASTSKTSKKGANTRRPAPSSRTARNPCASEAPTRGVKRRRRDDDDDTQKPPRYLTRSRTQDSTSKRPKTSS